MNEIVHVELLEVSESQDTIVADVEHWIPELHGHGGGLIDVR